MQLEERIEVHELDACEAVHFVAALHVVEIVVDGLESMRVAIGERIAHDGAIATNAHEVNSPRVDADALDVDSPMCGQFQSADNLVIEGEDVPIEVATHLNQRITEPRQFLHVQLSVCQCANDGSATRGSQVNGKE